VVLKWGVKLFYNCFYLLEELESGETLDAESLCELLLLGGIDLGKGVGWIVV
jgi:hypothetical protein